MLNHQSARTKALLSGAAAPSPPLCRENYVAPSLRRRGRRRPTEYDFFEAASDRLQVSDSRLDRLARDADYDRGAHRGHPVVEIRLAEEVGVDGDVADGGVEFAVQAFNRHFDCRCDVCVAHAECEGVAEIGNETATVLVVAIDDGRARVRDLVEQDSLRGEVAVEILMKIEVVAREIREDGGRELDAVRSLQRERVRRHLHHRVVHAGIDHLREPFVQHDRIGRRPIGGQFFFAGAIFDCADQANRLATPYVQI